MGRILPVGLSLVLLGIAGGDARAVQRVGEEVFQRIETPHPYRGPGDLPRPERIRQETLRHAGATYIAVHFERFELALGDYLIVRSPDGLQSWRYEGLGRAGRGLSPGGFWATHIKGDAAVVELYSRNDLGAHGFTIDRFARGYTGAELDDRAVGAVPSAPDTVCGTDDTQWAKCYQASEPQIYDRSRSVARLLISGSFHCTGWLLGCEGHLMTANHCIWTQEMADDTDYEFMAEGTTCSTSCAPSMGCPGVIAATTATLVKTDDPLDYTVLKLPTNVTPTYGFLSMRESGAVQNERIYVPQHPLGWGKRIAVFSTHALDQSGFCEINSINVVPCSGGLGDIGYYADTRGASSGAPVLAYADHRVVSLHHCGACQNRGLDVADLIADMGALLPSCATESAPPPLVRDVAVQKLVPSGAQLRVFWDSQCVNAPATAKILYGPLGQLTTYGLSGSLCAVAANPAVWSGVPPGSLWFVMSSDDSFGQEGSWGVDSSGQERNGLVPSGQCGSVEKNLSGQCP